MLNLLIVWVLLFVGLVSLAVDKRRGTGALALAYFFGLSVIHVPGVLAYLDPAMNWGAAEATKIGFEMTLAGMAAFIAGVGAARILARHADNEVSPQGVIAARSDLLDR